LLYRVSEHDFGKPVRRIDLRQFSYRTFLSRKAWINRPISGASSSSAKCPVLSVPSPPWRNRRRSWRSRDFARSSSSAVRICASVPSPDGWANTSSQCVATPECPASATVRLPHAPVPTSDCCLPFPQSIAECLSATVVSHHETSSTEADERPCDATQ